MAVVGDLPYSVRAGARGDERGPCSVTDGRLADRLERRPVDGAGAVAFAHRSGVPVEQIERAPLRVDEDVAEAGVGHADSRPPSACGLRLAGRPTGLAPATAAGDRQRGEQEQSPACEEGEGSLVD